MNTSRKSSSAPSYQTLEPRKLLAGDVSVALNGSTLTVLGDDDANQIQIIGRKDGSAVVTGLDGTTINGGTTAFSAAADLNTVQVQLEGGDDELTIRGLVLNNSLSVRAGDGDDSTDIQFSDVRGIEFSGNDGDDVMQFDNVFSQRSITIRGGDGNDTVAIGGMAADRDALIDTGSGDDSLVVDNLGIKENMTLLFGDGDDEALFAGPSYAYRGTVVLGDGDDSFAVLPTTNEATARFRRNLNVRGGDGNDAVVLDSSVSSSKRTRIDGGADADAFVEGDASLRRSRIRNFESFEIADLTAQLDAFYASLTANGVDVARFGGTEVIVDNDITPTLTLTSTALVQDVEGDPQLIDDALTLTGDDDEVVSSASVQIEGFQSGEETLDFTDTADIIGDFEDGTLTLTGDASLADYQAALRSVTYEITSISTSTADRTLNITVDLADADEASLTGSRTISIVGANSLSVTETDLTYSSGDGAVAIDDDLFLSLDADNQITGATIVLSNFQEDGDELAFTDIGTINGNVTNDLDLDTSTLTLSGAGTAAQYQAALRSVTFENSNFTSALSTRTADFTVNATDGDLTGSRTITLQTVDTAPTLSVRSSPIIVNVANVDGSGEVTPVSIDLSTDQITIADSNNEQLSQATVTIDEGRIDGDVLAFTQQAGITGTFDAATGVLTFTGDASLADYETVLRSVTFGISDPANIGQRTLSIEVTDISNNAGAAETDQAEIRVDVVTSDTVRLTTSSNDLVLGAGETRATVDQSALVVGSDSSVVTSATVQLTTGYQEGDDLLDFVSVSGEGITSSFDSAAGILTLSGSSTAAAYQAAIRNVFYENTDRQSTEGDRTVVITVNSDTAISDTRVITQGTFDRDTRDNTLLDQFIADNNLTGVQTTDSGLRFIVDTSGNGVSPTSSDSVRVNFTGTLLNGEVFDQDDDRTFDLQEEISGLAEGLQLFSEGGSGTLLIPSNLAYGDGGNSDLNFDGIPDGVIDGIPIFSNLIFEIELLEVITS